LIFFFKQTITDGGTDRILSYFKHPISNIEEIYNRQNAILFLSKRDIDFLFDRYVMAYLEKYLTLAQEPYSNNFFIEYITSHTLIFSIEKKRKAFFIKRSICELIDVIVN